MQLGKLDVSQSQPGLSCKTPDLPLQSAQWVTDQKQNSLRRLRAVNNVVAHLNERWRVIECAAGIQWILQHRAGERHGTARWDDRSYCRTREALIRCCRASAGAIEPAACTTLAALPQRMMSRSGDDKIRSPSTGQGKPDPLSSNAAQASTLTNGGRFTPPHAD